MATETVKWFNATIGYSFIQPDAGGLYVFLHVFTVERAGIRDLREGQKVAYEVAVDTRRGLILSGKHAEYVGLDPNFGSVANVRGETLGDHLHENSEAYDAVCALEHLASPTQMFADMVRAARPGGQVIVSVPHVPSALTRIPNNVINAPPHHLTWWTKPALRALAEAGGATVESIEQAEWNATDSRFTGWRAALQFDAATSIIGQLRRGTRPHWFHFLSVGCSMP